jgi:hypothetical protein
MPSFKKTLCRWYSTVLRLANSWPAASSRSGAADDAAGDDNAEAGAAPPASLHREGGGDPRLAGVDANASLRAAPIHHARPDRASPESQAVPDQPGVPDGRTGVRRVRVALRTAGPLQHHGFLPGRLCSIVGRSGGRIGHRSQALPVGLVDASPGQGNAAVWRDDRPRGQRGRRSRDRHHHDPAILRPDVYDVHGGFVLRTVGDATEVELSDMWTKNIRARESPVLLLVSSGWVATGSGRTIFRRRLTWQMP